MPELSDEQPPEQTPELDRKGRRRHHAQFKPGQSGNPHGRAGKPKPEGSGDEWTDDGLTTLQRMQRVFSQPKSRDRGPAEENLRCLLDEDRGKFVTQLVALERAVAAKPTGNDPSASDHTEPDGASIRVIEVAERVLREMKQQRETRR